MQRRRALRFASWLATSSLLMMSSVATADERTDARREFRSGMQAVAEGRYDEGVERLQRAYDLLPHPNVLYNIGLAHMYAGRPEDALEYFERYKEIAPASDAIEVDSLMKQLRAQLSPSSGAADPGAVEVTPGATLLTLEAAAQEVRRLAQEQNSDALKKQADELDRAVAKLRSEQAGEPVAPPAAVATAPESVEAKAEPVPTKAPILPTVDNQQKPATKLPVRGDVRQGVYEERVVSASRLSQSPLDAPNATAIITSQTIRMSGVTQLSALLRRVAGVEVATVAPYHAEISIRGLNRRSSNKVLLLWDGRPMRKDFMGTNWIDMVPILVDDIERIEIIRGPASALYGADAFAGVINIITRAPGEGGSFLVGRVGNDGQYQGGMSFAGKVSPKVAYRASAFYTQANNSVQVVGNNRVDVARPNGEPARSFNTFNTNGDLSYTYAKNSVASIGGNFTGGDDTIQGLSRLNQVVSDPSYEAQVYGVVTTPIGVRIFSNYDQLSGHPRPAYLAPQSISSARSFIEQRLYDLDVSYSTTFDLLFKHTLTVGASYRYKHIDWSWLDATHSQNHVGAYLQDVMQLAQPLKLQIGARIDHHPLLSSLQFSPRASLVYRFLGEQSLRLSGGRAFRGPSFLESYLQLPNDTPLRGITAWGKGNDKLDPESITSLELGYQNQQSDYFSLEANLYYNWIKDAILFTDIDPFTLGDYAGGNPLATYNRNVQAFPVSSLSFANERATYRQIGGELGARVFPIEGLDVYANYSINQTKPNDKGRVDPARANEQQTSLHKVNSGVQYRAPFGLEGSVDVSWSSPQRWIEQVTDISTGVRWQRYDQPSFVMLSARLGYRLFADRLELGVVGTNLAFEHKRQQPISQPIDTRVLGTAKVRF
ncbi:MAG: Outer rane vitamin receptor BtuB [Myxococcaceae bacterium]|nr:Outer rane vitamin receptor BtuB [Myxococcaceae bacterium]